MTKKDALTIAMSTLSAPTYPNPNFDGKETTRREFSAEEVREVLQNMIEQLSKPHKTSDDAKARAKAKRANDRAVVVAQIAPILREGLTHTLQGITAKELFSLVKGKLPEDYTAAKVQAMLLRDMRDELIITEVKGKANTYALKSEVNQ